MTATAELPVDLGPCRWCDDPQWRHKRGKGGCQEVGCGCDKYGPPKSVLPAGPASAVEANPAIPVPGVLVDGPDVPGPAEQVGAGEPARPGDVDLPPPADDWPLPAAEVEDAEAAGLVVRAESPANEAGAPVSAAEGTQPVDEQLERQRLVAQLAQLTAENERLRHTNVELGRARAECDRVARSVIEVTGERDKARADLAALRGTIADEGRAAERKLGQLARENTRLREDLTRAEGDRDAAREALRKTAEAYLHTSIDAATKVLWRYDARQCLDCGRRYTVDVEHEHPLTPVTVLVVRRDVPGA